jgi:hypothetical protein
LSLHFGWPFSVVEFLNDLSNFLVWQMPQWPCAVVCRGEGQILTMPESSVVAPILMNSEQPFGISAATAAPIAFFSSAATNRRAS